jgi:hypothetical protein
MKLSFNFGKIKTINDVFYVPNFMKNLLWIGMITNKGHVIVFESNKCLIVQNKDPHTIVVKGWKHSKVYN